VAQIEIQVGQLDPESDAADLDVSLPVAGPTPLYFDDPSEAQPYPLAQKLLGLEQISAILLQGQRITLCRANEAGDWDGVIAAACVIVNGHFADQPEAKPARDRTPEEGALMVKIQNILNEEINPFISAHGGFIEVRDVKDSIVYVNMSGGCQGCAQSEVTLRQGVERVLAEKVPEITRILDATDHEAGTNPFYR